MTRILYLDGWRGLAILGVLVDHYITSQGINLGRFGVELFFVLSGRLMGEILFSHGAELKTFYFRRISRIYPALLFCMTVTFALAFVLKKETFVQYLSAITLTYNYAQLWTGRWMGIDHVWSLCVEEHMYILLGVVALIARRFKASAMLIIAAIAVVFVINGLVWHLAGYDYYQVYWRSDVRGASILMGAAVYLALRQPWAEGLRSQPFTSIGALLVGLLLNINTVPDPLKYSLGTLLLAVSVAALPTAKLLPTTLSWKPLVYLGTISYSLYLWQQVWVMFMHKAAEKLQVSHLVLVPPVLAVVFAAALVSFYFVEKPARIKMNQLLDHMRKEKAPA